MTFVSAPAGFGKTTAVRVLLRRSGERVAWLQVDPEDNDPMLLWRRTLAETTGPARRGPRSRRSSSSSSARTSR